MARFSFPRQARLRREVEFRRVYARGLCLREFPLRVHALRRRTGRSRLGLSVSRKVGGPVVRNRWKRAVREAFRLNRHRLTVPYDIVVSVSWEARPEDVDRVAECFARAIELLNTAPGAPEGGNGSAPGD